MHPPRALAKFNRYVTNPIQRLWAGRLKSYAIIEHVGRKSGKTYRTPVLTFRTPEGFSFLVGYGTESDWVKNLLAANGGVVVHQNKRYPVTNVSLLSPAEGRAVLPKALRSLTKVVNEGNVLTVTLD